MPVKKRGKSWQVTAHYRGRRVRRTAETYQAGKILEAKLTSELIRNKSPLKDIEAALTRYLKGDATRLKDYEGLKSKARAILPAIKDKAFDEISEVAETIKERKLAPATINRRLALLRRLGNLAFQWGWIEYPAGKKVKLLPENNERHYYLTPDQIELLAENCPVAGDTILMAAYTGLRRSELLWLTADNYRDGRLILSTRTKSGKPRAIPVPKRIKKIAENLPLQVTDWILRQEFEAARVVIEMPWLHFHDLRHSYASLLADSGVPPRTIGELLGDSSAAMIKRYSHLSAGHLDLAVQKMTRHISRHKKKRASST